MSRRSISQAFAVACRLPFLSRCCWRSGALLVRAHGSRICERSGAVDVAFQSRQAASVWSRHSWIVDTTSLLNPRDAARSCEICWCSVGDSLNLFRDLPVSFQHAFSFQSLSALHSFGQVRLMMTGLQLLFFYKILHNSASDPCGWSRQGLSLSHRRRRHKSQRNWDKVIVTEGEGANSRSVAPRRSASLCFPTQIPSWQRQSPRWNDKQEDENDPLQNWPKRARISSSAPPNMRWKFTPTRLMPRMPDADVWWALMSSGTLISWRCENDLCRFKDHCASPKTG